MMRSLLVFALLAATAAAQITPVILNGAVFDGNGGPLTAGNVYHIEGNGGSCGISVPAGETLTIEAGTVIKVNGCFLIQGTVLAIGNAVQRIIITSTHDDTAGGDSNGNGGLTSPQPGDWGYIDAGGDCTFEWCTFRFAGSSNAAALDLRLQPHLLRDCRFESLQANGFSAASDVTAERCHFADLGGIPCDDLHMKSIAQFVDNTAINCAGGNYATIIDGTPTPADLVMSHDYTMNGTGVFVFRTLSQSVQVQAGSSLTFPAGTICKFDGGSIRSQGQLIALGTTAQPVVFTSIQDDSFGGDTRNDGAASLPAPGDWVGLNLLGGDASELTSCIVRFAGMGGQQAIRTQNCSPIIRNSIIAESAGDGIGNFELGNPPMQILDCLFVNNANLSVHGLRWQELARCSRNAAINNGSGDHFLIVPQTINSTTVITPDQFPGDVLEVTARTTIGSGGSLTLPPGLIIKSLSSSQSGFSINSASAQLHLRGTGSRPIVLTSLRDDSIGGDTNNDGAASQPAPGDIRRIWIGSSAGNSTFEHVNVRYASTNAFECVSANATIRSVRVDHASGAGFRLHAALGDIDNLVAYGCSGNGIECQNGAYDLRHATAANNAGDGIKRTSLWSGQLINSNSWGNTGLNIDVPAGQQLTNNGVGPLLAGSNGHLDVDPLFVDASNGDLQLQASSPCLGAAHMPTAIAVVRDHDEGSRISDHDVSGVALPDIGAFERPAYTMSITGVPKLGTTMTYTIDGPTGIGIFFISQTDSPGFLLPPLGFALLGVPNASLGGLLLMGQSVVFPMPAPGSGLDGVRFDVQGIGLEFSGPDLLGGFTRVDRNWIY